MQDFNAALTNFLALAQNVVDSDRRFPNLPYRVVLVVDEGKAKKYVRVVKTEVRKDTGAPDPMARSVFCFVDMATGDVLKAESWKKPAKHARGNIYAADGGVGGITAYGGTYLR